MVEQIANHLPGGAGMTSYSTAVGTKMDVVAETGQRKIGFEVKFSSAPTVTKGFWRACDDLQLDAAYVVAPVAEGWTMKAPAEVIWVMDIPKKLQVYWEFRNSRHYPSLNYGAFKANDSGPGWVAARMSPTATQGRQFLLDFAALPTPASAADEIAQSQPKHPTIKGHRSAWHSAQRHKGGGQRPGDSRAAECHAGLCPCLGMICENALPIVTIGKDQYRTTNRSIACDATAASASAPASPGAISASGTNTKARCIMRGCGTVKCVESMLPLP